jgi:hypothetical protein
VLVVLNFVYMSALQNDSSSFAKGCKCYHFFYYCCHLVLFLIMFRFYFNLFWCVLLVLEDFFNAVYLLMFISLDMGHIFSLFTKRLIPDFLCL